MRILHLASFDGNIGDNASHIGFNTIISNVFSEKVDIDKLEIRKFYNNYSLKDKRFFDESFADQANQYDLLVIGGGGFLDFDIKNSVTGTTLNISNKVLDLIKTPVFISSIGSNPRNAIPEENIEKFRNFLSHFLANKRNFIGVRNDGSKDAIKKYIGDDFANAIPQVLDHGFFYENDGSYYRPTPKPYVLINTTQDQIIMGKGADAGQYVNEMGKVLSYVLEDTDLDIVFAPHIYGDLGAIDALLKNVNDFYVRQRISITPYAQSDSGCNQIFSAYKNSALVMGMRFHASVCSIAMNVPSLAIAALDRVSKVYEDMGLSQRVITIDKPFSDTLIKKIKEFKTDKYGNENQSVLAARKADMINLYKDKLSKIL